MKTKEYTYISSSNLCEIKAWQWYPDNENVKAVIQIHHGMAEHCGRYKNAVEAFVSMGYAVFMNDMINQTAMKICWDISVIKTDIKMLFAMQKL